MKPKRRIATRRTPEHPACGDLAIRRSAVDPPSPAELAFLELVKSPRALHAWGDEVRYQWIERWAIQNETRLAAENRREMGPENGMGRFISQSSVGARTVAILPPTHSRSRKKAARDPRQGGFGFG